MDVGAFNQAIRDAAEANGYRCLTLGTLMGHPILLVIPPKFEGKRLLVAGGIHGDEPTGREGALALLKRWPKVAPPGVSASFIPLLNPVGAERGTREGFDRLDPNRGWVHNMAPTPELAALLLPQKDLLVGLAGEACLSLHSDSDYPDVSYTFTYERRDTPGEFSRVVNHGIPAVPVYNRHDGSFEDWLFHAGVPRVATTEMTPEMHVRTVLRVAWWLAG